MSNPFEYKTAARRYREGRPYYHPLVFEMVSVALNWDEPFERALDVACGTGLSCLALKPYARLIVGTDRSDAMLAEAPADPSIQYVHAPAESLPFPDASFDLITVGCAFHWLDQERFLREANRLLPVGRWLVIYGNNFRNGNKIGCPEFHQWYLTRYSVRYPAPPRRAHRWMPFDRLNSESMGFVHTYEQAYTNDVTFTLAELIHYLTTQSNIIEAVEKNGESLDEARAWLESEISPFFKDSQAAFVFGGEISCLQKQRHL